MAITKINTPELFDLGTTNSSLRLPSGDTASRPSNPNTGEWRYNTDDNYVEYWDSTAWFQIDYETAAATCTTDTINYPSGTTNTAYYKMSDATDSTLNGYNGTATNVNFNVQGKFGNAGEFNGSSSFINLGSTIDNPLRTAGAFGISMWFKTPSGGQVDSYGGKLISLLDNIYLFINIQTNNTLLARVLQSNGTQREFTTSALSASTWYHIVFTGNSSNGVTLYLNGSSQGNLSFDGTFYTYTDPSYKFNYLGYQGSGVSYLTGTLDQVRIYDSALSADNVTSLYNEVQCVPAIIPSDYFNPLLYNGNGGTQSIDDLTFQPDFVWIKARDNGVNNHLWTDSIRGVGVTSSVIGSNLFVVTNYNFGHISAFDSNGFTVAQGSSSGNYVNSSSATYVAWNWKAGGAPTTTNSAGAGNVPTAGSVKINGADSTTALAGTKAATSISANTDAGFSIVETSFASGESSSTVGHGLSSPPEMVIVKRTDAPDDWYVKYNVVDGSADQMRLNTTALQEAALFIPTPTTVIGFAVSGAAHTTIAYCFHSVDGMSDIGSYVGTGVAGNTIVTGFRPAFLMTKRSDTGGTDWHIWDNKINPSNPVDNVLFPNEPYAEADYSAYPHNFLSNGFSVDTTNGAFNASGGSYIYLAIAEQVYNANAVTANQTNPFNDGSQVAQYEFEDNAYDSQPNGYIGKGGTFNGSSSVITIPNIKSQLQSGASFTISCWVNVSSSQSGEAMIINTAASSGTQGVNIGIRASTGLVYFQIRGNNNLNASGTTNLVGAGWKNIVLTHTTSSTILYVNGTQEASIGANTIGTIPNDLTFGKWANSSLYYLNGSIDQVRIYNTALNPNDVWLLYSETSATSSTLDYPASTGAIALYELEGDATSTSSSTYDGAATNVAWVPLYDGAPTSMTYAAPSVSTPFLKAGVFNGSSSYVTLPAGINKNNNFSWSFWVNFDSLTDYDTPIAFQNTYRNYLDILANGTLHFYDGVSLNSPTGTVTTGTWYHVVITKSSSTGRKMYLNNSVVASDSGTTNSISGGGQNLIGAYNSSGTYNYHLDGEIDQVRIFNKALDEGEILQLYNEPNN